MPASIVTINTYQLTGAHRSDIHVGDTVLYHFTETGGHPLAWHYRPGIVTAIETPMDDETVIHVRTWDRAGECERDDTLIPEAGDDIIIMHRAD